VRLKGRHWIAFWLVALLAVFAEAHERWIERARLDPPERTPFHADVVLFRRALRRRVRVAQSRAVLLPRAQRLGLRLPADTEIILIPSPTSPTSPTSPNPRQR